MGKAGKIASMASDESQEQRQRSFWKHKIAKNSPFLYADGHLPLHKLGVGTDIPKI